MYYTVADKINLLVSQLALCLVLCFLLDSVVREFKIQWWRRPRERHLKSEFAFFQSLSQLLQLIYFVKYKQILFEPNS